MNPESGAVTTIRAIPGEVGLLRVEFVSNIHKYGTSAWFDIASVTVNGQPTNVGDFFAWLLETPDVAVTVHPDKMRYGLSTKTEFVEVK